MTQTDHTFNLNARDSTAAAVRSAKGNFNDLDKTLKTIGKTVGAAFAVNKIVDFVTSSIQAGDDILQFSQKIGITTEAFSQLNFAAGQTSDVTGGALTQALQKMTTNISLAADGTGKAVTALDELGISAEKLEQLAPDEQFYAIARGMETVENRSDQLRIATKLFGASGAGLVDTLDEGSEALREYASEADALGLTFSAGDLKAVAQTQDDIDKMTSAVKSLGIAILGELSPYITSLVNFLTKTAIPAFRSFAQEIFGVEFRINSLNADQLEKESEKIISRLNAINKTFEQRGPGKARGLQDSYRKELEQERADLQARLFEIDKREQDLKKAPEIPNVGGETKSKGEIDKRISEAQREADAIKKMYESQAESIFESTRLPHEQLIADQEELREVYDQGFLDNLGGEETFRRKQTELSQNYTDYLRENIDKVKDKNAAAEQEKFNDISQGLANVTTLMNSSSKKQFQIGKIAAIANAIMNTREGITKTLAKYPGPLGIALAVAQGVAGFAQVQGIQNTQFAGGNPTGTVTGGGAGSGLVTQPVDTSTQSPQEPLRRVVVVFEGVNDNTQMNFKQARTYFKQMLDEVGYSNIQFGNT